MAGNALLRLTAVFGVAAVVIYLTVYLQTRFVAVPAMFLPTEQGTELLYDIAEIVAGPMAFVCVFFTVAATAFWHLAGVRPSARVLLVAGLLTPPYLLGLYLVGDANPANSLMRFDLNSYTGSDVYPKEFDLGWGSPTLTAVLAVAAIAQVWGVMRLARGLEAVLSPHAARLLFLQPVWYAAYLAVCAFDIWFVSVTARPATLDELAWGPTPDGLVRDAWSMLLPISIAMAVGSAATAATGMAVRRGSAGVRVLAGVVTPLNVLGLAVLVVISPLGQGGGSGYAETAAAIRPVWHLPLLTALAGGAMISHLYVVIRAEDSSASRLGCWS